MSFTLRTAGALALLTVAITACGSTPDGDPEANTEAFVFHVAGVLGRPGMFTEDMSASIEGLLLQVDGVRTVKVMEHPDNRLENDVTVRFDPEETDRETIVSEVGTEWEMVWYGCDTCGRSYAKWQICHGRPTEESFYP